MSSDFDYVIDFYVNDRRVDYFPPYGRKMDQRLEDIKEWAFENKYLNYKIVIKELNYWYIYEFNPKINELLRKRKIYLIQINTIAEIEERFKGDRIA